MRVVDETSVLEKVIVGIAEDFTIPIINPEIRKHYTNGGLPSARELQKEMDGFCSVLEDLGVEVLRPENIPGQYQVFARDIGFVVDDVFVVANMKEPSRQNEYKGILGHVDDYIVPPAGAYVEGGDVVLYDGHIFVGVGERTNSKGAEFLRKSFPLWEVIELGLRVSSNDHKHILHLDCTFQTYGDGKVGFRESGIVSGLDAVYDIFGEERLRILKGKLETNFFSVAPDKVVVLPGSGLEGVENIEVPYFEIGKLGGSFRCTTLPLIRKY